MQPGQQPGEGQGQQPGKGQQTGQDQQPPTRQNDQNPSESEGTPNPSGSPNRRGGRGANDPGTNKFEDKTQPLPPVSQKSSDGTDPSVAPDAPKTDLVLRKLQDLIKEDKFTPNVEKQLGMTKDEAEQFVKKFEKRDQPGPAGPGREIKAKPDKEKVLDPNRKAPELNTTATVSNRNNRQGTTLPQDNLHGLSEGAKSSPPPELRRQVDAYMKSLSNTTRGAATGGSTPPAKR